MILKLITAVSMVLLSGLYFACQDQSDNKIVNGLINVRHLNSKTIIVNFGYDAVTGIKTDSGIVVVDAGISNRLTEKFRNKIKKEFNSNHFAFLVNTHSHRDHTGGNQVFNEAVIVAHKNCFKEMAEATKYPEVTKNNLLKIIDEYEKDLEPMTIESKEWKETFSQMMRYKFAYMDLSSGRVVTYPQSTFTDTMKISLGDVTMDMMYFGKAHSASDILIHVPELGILFTGDLFFPGGRPSLNEYSREDVKKWLIAKQWTEDRLPKIETVIGGHGQIMYKKDLLGFFNFINAKKEGLK